jgi:hypothetical protein
MHNWFPLHTVDMSSNPPPYHTYIHYLSTTTKHWVIEIRAIRSRFRQFFLPLLFCELGLFCDVWLCEGMCAGGFRCSMPLKASSEEVSQEPLGRSALLGTMRPLNAFNWDGREISLIRQLPGVVCVPTCAFHRCRSAFVLSWLLLLCSFITYQN